MFNEILTLLKVTETVDDYGDRIKIKTGRDVFARMDRVYLSEAIQGQATGFKPELRFTLADYYDYDNEPEAVYENRLYRVLNTMRKGIELELVLYGGIDYEQGS